jgi:hypothetical protein
MAEWLGGLGPCDPEGDEERRDATANGTDPTTEGSCERLCFVEICRPERCHQADEDHDRDELRQQRTQRETDPAEGHFLGISPVGQSRRERDSHDISRCTCAAQTAQQRLCPPLTKARNSNNN